MATAETQKIVDQLNAGTTTIADLVKLYPSFFCGYFNGFSYKYFYIN